MTVRSKILTEDIVPPLTTKVLEAVSLKQDKIKLIPFPYLHEGEDLDLTWNSQTVTSPFTLEQDHSYLISLSFDYYLETTPIGAPEAVSLLIRNDSTVLGSFDSIVIPNQRVGMVYNINQTFFYKHTRPTESYTARIYNKSNANASQHLATKLRKNYVYWNCYAFDLGTGV